MYHNDLNSSQGYFENHSNATPYKYSENGSSSDYKNNGNQGNIEISYEFDTLNLVSASFGASRSIYTSQNDGYSQFYDKNRNIVSAYKDQLGALGAGAQRLLQAQASLYAILQALARPEVNIITVEDPVEYALPGVAQIQVNEKAGVTFASALRSILRQDPDIVMIGEMRDFETAHIGVQASLTGHLVLSTLHTNDSIGAIVRLVDMGIEPYLAASCMIGTVAQRLARRLCPHCRHEVEPPALMARQGLERAWAPTGCPECHGTAVDRKSVV